MIGWNIVRSKPIARTYGRAIPAFIHNFQYHFVTVDAYSDGAIDCWGFVDRSLFVAKIRSGWVATMPPIGEVVSIFDLGQARVEAAEWSLSPASLNEIVEAAIQELNPTMTGLIDMHGEDSELRGKVRDAKLSLADETPFRVASDGSEVRGHSLPVFMPTSDAWRLTQWFIYADGLSQFGYLGDLVPMGDAVNLIRSGKIAMAVPDGSWIQMDHLGRFRTKEGWWKIMPDERIREAYDQLDILHGNDGSIERCRAALRLYLEIPSDESRESLRRAYEAVPKHLQMYCGDQDSKDGPIRRILYPNEHRR